MIVCRYCEGPLTAGERLQRRDGRTERLHAGNCARAYYAERKAASRARRRSETDVEPPRKVRPGPVSVTSSCSVAQCLRRHYAKGLCLAHYQRKRYGSGDVFTPVRERPQ